jgi:hypothetical protein
MELFMQPTIEHQNILTNFHQIYRPFNENINLLFNNNQNHVHFLSTSNQIVEIYLPKLLGSSNIFMKIYSTQNQQLIKTLSIETFIQQLPNCKLLSHQNCQQQSKDNLNSCSTINIDQCKYRENKTLSAHSDAEFVHRGHGFVRLYTTTNIQTMEKNQIINTEYCIALIRYGDLYHVVHIWNMNTSELLGSHILSEMSTNHILCSLH